MEVVEDSAAAGPVVGGDSDYSDTGCHGVSRKYSWIFLSNVLSYLNYQPEF